MLSDFIKGFVILFFTGILLLSNHSVIAQNRPRVILKNVPLSPANKPLGVKPNQLVDKNADSTKNISELLVEPAVTSVQLAKADNTNSNTNKTYIDYYKKIETYIPDESSPEKHIRIAFNIFTGPGTIQKNDKSIADLRQIGAWLNAFYTNVDSPTYQISGVPWIKDTKIRFDIDDRIYFYNNTKYANSTSIYEMEKYIASVDSNRLNNLNIYITAGGKATAYSISPYPSFVSKGASGSSSNGLYGNLGVYISSINPNYVNSQTIAHEIGHCLDLLHTYEPSCCHETCDASDPEYLYDLFGLNPPAYCWERGHFGCSITPSENTCTNNIMGGNNLLTYYFSPMQIGKMHRALSIKSVRKCVKSECYDVSPIKVKGDQNWNFDIRCYSDIIVESGKTLTISGKVLMAETAKIIVKRNAKLILDGGEITAAGNYWQGIDAKKGAKVLKSVFGNNAQVIFQNNGSTNKVVKNKNTQ